MPKTTTKKAKKAIRKAPTPGVSARTATLAENPSWLFDRPEGKAPDPPAVTRGQVLPFTGIEWKDFERLCLKLAARDGTVEAAWSYGTAGQAQYGIDVLVRLKDGTYEVWQTKRYQAFSAANVEAAVGLFLEHKWAAQAKRFVLAVTCELDKRNVVEALEAARDLLADRNIVFDPRGASKLTQDLHELPDLIDDFFDRPWVERICSAEAVRSLEQRYSRFEEAALREKLRACYRSWISAVDPGWLVAGLDSQGRPRASVPITDRYVQPDVMVKSNVEERSAAEGAKPADTFGGPVGQPAEGDPAQRRHRNVGGTQERRVGLDQYLSTKSQSLIVAEAGSGKSSLLRYIAMDMLSDEPVFQVSRGQFAGSLPVWVSFALWTRMAANQASPPPVEEVITEFLRALDETDLADALKRAVSSGKIVLLVDGLDEAQDVTVAQTLVALLTAFAERRGIPVVATSRPHGVRNIGGFGGNWDRVELAPLSDPQRYELARLWFRLLEAAETGASGVQVDTQARRKTDLFIQALKRNPGVTRLSQTPLFLLAFMDLHRHGQSLPRSRFAASREIVEQLMEHQPRRREVGALARSVATTDSRLRDRIIADFAFALQSGELQGAVPDAVSEEDAVLRGTQLILSRQGDNHLERAEATSREIFSFTEERAGLLVKKTPQTVGFLHLSLQEFLAARHLRQRSLEEKIAFVSQHAARPRWREPILYLLSLLDSEHEVGQLVVAIEEAPATNRQEMAFRDELLTDAVFSDFSHDLGIVRRLAAGYFEDAELTAWGARQRRLLAAVVDGLSSESVRDVCRAKLSEWIPDRHGYYREGAIRAMPAWGDTLKPACEAVLFRCLRSENDHIWRAAAEVLPRVTGNCQRVKARLLSLAKNAPSVDTAHAAFVSLANGWHADADIGVIAAELRVAGHSGLQTEAIRVRAQRGETDKGDLDAYCGLAFDEERYGEKIYARDLAEHFAVRHREAFTERLETKIRASHSERISRITQMVASLILCDPDNALAHRELPRILSQDWAWRELFSNLAFPFDRITWTDELRRCVELYVASKEKYRDYELYWISKVIKLPILKEGFLKNIREGKHQAFWSSKGLAEGWGREDADVRDTFAVLANGEPEVVAQIAEQLPLIVEDREACRDALLRCLRAPVERYDHILLGCKNLGLTEADEEVVQAALAAGSNRTAPLYHDIWCDKIIQAFPRHPEVRKIALSKITERDAPVGAIAEYFSFDEEVCRQLLPSICPLNDDDRAILLSRIGDAASYDHLALGLLDAARKDSTGIVCAEATMGWVEAKVNYGPLGDGDVEWLVSELDAMGSEFQMRRTAAAIGLIAAGYSERLVNAKSPDGKPVCVEANPRLRGDDLFMRRVEERWDEMTAIFGSEEIALERFEITPERMLGYNMWRPAKAGRILKLMLAQASTAKHVGKHDMIFALEHSEPQGATMRDILVDLFRDRADNFGRSNAEHWGILKAGEIFAEHFAGDKELRQLAIDAFDADPTHNASAVGLSELLLRKPDTSLRDLMHVKTTDVNYPIGTFFKLIAALARPEVFADQVMRVFSEQVMGSIGMQYWMPTLLRRIRLDNEVQEEMLANVTNALPVTTRVPLLAMLGRALGPTDRIRRLAGAELENLQQVSAPQIVFDVTTQAWGPAWQILTDLAE